jgi:hypothetical protein
MGKVHRRNGRPPESAEAEDERQQTDEILREHRKVYERDRDPFRAWGAFMICRARGRKIPPWFMKYLDEAVQEFQGVYEAARKDRPALLARALGFTRDGAPTKPKDRGDEIARAVVEAKRTTRKLTTAKRKVAADWGLSFSTVDTVWRGSPYSMKRKKVT